MAVDHSSIGARSTTPVDFALLVLRGWVGIALLALHGWPKVTGFSGMSAHFPNPIGLGSEVTLAIAAVLELVGALFLILGFLTRWAAVAIGVELLLAYVLVHRGALSGAQSGELAVIYAGAVLALAIAGGGRFSLDRRMSWSSRRPG